MDLDRDRDGKLIGLLNTYTEMRMRNAPSENCGVSGVWNRIVDRAVAKTTETPVAKPFRTLSAYCVSKHPIGEK